MGERQGWICGAFGFLSHYERGTVSILDNSHIPSIYLFQNYPNPFNPKTVISYQLSENSDVEISVYNSLGQKVEILFSGTKAAGRHNTVWQAENYPSGVYYYQLKTNANILTKKMILMK